VSDTLTRRNAMVMKSMGPERAVYVIRMWQPYNARKFWYQKTSCANVRRLELAQSFIHRQLYFYKTAANINTFVWF
jgi:hypothetical protein